MKRHDYLYEQLCSMDNLRKAEQNARRNKGKQYGVLVFDRDKEANLQKLHQMILSRSYKTSPYRTFKVYDPKEREVYALPYFPDRIFHHLMMIPLEPIFNAMYTADTYSCIKGRGITDATFSLRRALINVPETLYCLKIDVKKFYPSVDHDILKAMFLRKIKDGDFIRTVFEIIDSAAGLPIGNLSSQAFANFYLTPFDHWVKEKLGLKNYFRYMDDIVILAPDKKQLHSILWQISDYWQQHLKLTLKHNYQVFPVAKRGIDFVGYRHYHGYTLLRKGIKSRFKRMMAHNRNKASIASYRGWLKHGDCKRLTKKYFHERV